MAYVYRGNQPIIQKQAPVPHPGSALEPCGTIGAAQRHWVAKEPLCDPCREARRAYDRERKRIQRANKPKESKARKVQPCGTHAAAQRHYSRGEPICDPCRLAKLAYEKERRQPKLRNPAKCGTYPGYARHLRRGEKACQPCRVAWNEYQRARRNNQRMTSSVPNGTIYPTNQKAAA